MLTDRYGLAVSTASEAARDAYVEGCDLVLSGNAGAEAAFDRAIAADPRFVLAHAAKARSHQIRGEGAAARQAISDANAAATDLPAREASHLAFCDLLIAGRGDDALTAAKEHLKSWPRDAMVLTPCSSVFGLIGFSGRAGREQEQVALLASVAPHYGDDWWFTAQYAFALDEAGQREVARPMIERSMAAYPRNAHGAHIRAHVYYEDGEQTAARANLKAWLPGYSREGQLFCHLNWHLALCALEAGDMAEASRIYAENIAPDAIWGPPLNALTDSASFLWRAELAGFERDQVRWRIVHDFAHKMFPRAGVAFADAHVALADAVCGDGGALEARVRDMEDMGRQARFASGPVVPALSRAFAAFLRRDYDGVVATLEPIVREHERVGGSRAQRDLIEFTLLKAYCLAGRTNDALHFVRRRRHGLSNIPVAGVPQG